MVHGVCAEELDNLCIHKIPSPITPPPKPQLNPNHVDMPATPPPQPDQVEMPPEPELMELDILEDIPDITGVPEEVLSGLDAWNIVC